MRIASKTDSRLVLIDEQKDKQIALGVLSVGVVVISLFLAWDGVWAALLVGAVVLAAIRIYAKASRMRSELVLDRDRNQATLEVANRTGIETWSWPLDDIRTAEVSTVGEHGTDSGRHRPVLILQDGTPVPVRPYHSAGSQSWHVVAAIKLFLGQDLHDAPVGWIPPEAFDQFFAKEMKKHYKQG